MSEVRRQISELLLEAWRLEHSPQQVEKTEEAVRLADAHGEVELAFEAREALIEAATFAAFPEKALVAFTWCLGQCDQDPDRFQEAELLWQYKWVAGDLPFFPQIARERILAIHDDMAERYARCGRSLQPIHKIRWLAALRMGDMQAAARHHDLAQRTPRDSGSDCAACDLDDEVSFLIALGRAEDAVRAAAPILAGLQSCASVPHVTLASLLRPLLQLGRVEEAARHHRRGYRLISGNRRFVDAAGAHLEFLTLTGNQQAATRVFEAHVQPALEATDLDDRFEFLSAATLFLRWLSEVAPGATLRLPASFPRTPSEGAADATGLARWFDEAAAGLADRFDARNGNPRYRQRHEERLGLQGVLSVPFPLA